MSDAVLNPVRNPARPRLPTLARTLVLARALVPVLLLAGVLRLTALGRSPFSMVESATAGFAGLSWHELFFGLGRLETNPPSFYALEKLWTGLAGTSDLAFRVPPALLGVAGVAAVAMLARAAFGPRAAVWAGLLMAVQPHHLDHSREARVYTLLFLAVALAVLAGRRVAVWRGSALPWRPAAALAALSAAAMMLHDTGPVAVACLFAYAGVAALRSPGPRLPRLRMLAAAGMGALALALPALLAILEVAGDPLNNAAWIVAPGWEMSWVLTLSVLAAPLDGLQVVPAPLIGGCVVFGALSLGFALRWAVRQARADADAAGMLAGLLLALALLIGLSQAVPILLERTLMFSLVFFVPLLGAALAAMPAPMRAAMLAVVALAQAPGLALVLGGDLHGQDWREVAAVLHREAVRTGWPVMVAGGFDAAAVERYLPAGDPARPVVSITPALGGRVSEAFARLATGAEPLPQGMDGDALCRLLGQPGGVLLLVRDASPRPPMHPVISRLLTEAGGMPDGATVLGNLEVERWPGVCRHP